MNEEKVKAIIAEAIGDIEDATEGKLQKLLDEWPKSADAEMTRLAQFEISARECLESGVTCGTPWVDENGIHKRAILVDEEKVLKLLGR